MVNDSVRNALLVLTVLGAGSAMRAQDAAVVADAGPVAVEQPSMSQVRIVRLSDVRGVVQMDRNTGRGYEAGFANIPVVAGAKLRTLQGVAEVEFEDNSSLRLAPDTEVTFSQLGRGASGATETTVTVVKGMVYAGLEKTKGNVFSLVDGSARVVLMPGAHLRLDASGPDARVAVFDGAAQVRMGSAAGEVSTLVTKKQTLQLNPATQTVSTVQKGTEEVAWDVWDKKENDFHKQKASLAGSGGFGQYGANDLSYYGSFVDMPGCGQMWRPYFASAAWDPFASGVWAYYPTAGYSWVSPYPWGWLPYHSGTWASCGGAGWGWRPGGSWYGLSNAVTIRNAKYPIQRPLPGAPNRSAGTLVPVNMKQLPASGVTGGAGAEAFTFRRDSAGLGVPRATLGNLHSLSAGVERHGVATTGLGATTLATPLSAHQTGGPVSRGAPGAGSGAAPAAGRGVSPANAGSLSGPARSGAISSPSAPSAPRSAGPSVSAPSTGGRVGR